MARKWKEEERTTCCIRDWHGAAAAKMDFAGALFAILCEVREGGRLVM
jgi:hypothetical protein